MKAAVYVGMCLLFGPIFSVAGVAVSSVFLVAMLGLGVHLLVGRKDRRGEGPQPVPPPAPQVVLVVPGMAPWPVPGEGQALHPARRPDPSRPPLWAGPSL